MLLEKPLVVLAQEETSEEGEEERKGEGEGEGES